MRLTVNVLWVMVEFTKKSKRYVCCTLFKEYHVLRAIMCRNGDCLVAAVLNEQQLICVANDKRVQILTTVEYNFVNVELLKTKICTVMYKYEEYCDNYNRNHHNNLCYY